MSAPIPAVPAGLAGDQLIATLNDRIRRINLAGAGATGPAGKAGSPGTPGTPGGAGGVGYPVPIAGGIATPDCSKALNVLTLPQDRIKLALPASPPTGVNVNPWTLAVLQGTGTAVFAGTGTLTARSAGTYSSYAPGDTTHVYVVTISATGATDHFTWTKDGGAASAPIAITGAAQALADGITVQFAGITGGVLGDNWTIQCGGFSLDTTAYAQLPNGASNPQSPPGTECVLSFLTSVTGTRSTGTQMNLVIT